MGEKILILGDIHIGARNSSKIFRQLFREYFRDCVFPLVKERKIDKIIQLGDFFDNRNSVSLQDIDYIVNEFIPLLEKTNVNMYVLAGNHDVAYKNTNKVNSLSILKSCKNVIIVDNSIEVIKTESKNFVLCPWINNENQEELITKLNQYASNDNILCGHFEFIGMKMYKNSKLCEHGLDPLSFKDFYAVYSGHFHHKSSYGNVSYLGSVFHLNWQDYGDDRFIHIFDTNKDSLEAIENPYSLFTEFDYHDDLIGVSDDELEEFCEGQFVKIVINNEYKRLELKDIIHRIEKYKPISVDVVDNNIYSKLLTKDINEEKNSNNKEIIEYVDMYIDDKDKDKKNIMRLFEEIKIEAQENMMEIE